MVVSDSPPLAPRDSSSEEARPPNRAEKAAYIADLAEELAEIAAEAGLRQVAAALELSRGLAREAVALHSRSLSRAEPGPANAAPDDAA